MVARPNTVALLGGALLGDVSVTTGVRAAGQRAPSAARSAAAVLAALSLLAVGCAGKGRVDAYNEYAVAAARNRLWAEAARRWEQALELDDDDERIWNNLGVAYEAEERFDDAIRAYTEAADLDPENSHFIRNLRRCERNRDRATAMGDTPNLPDEDELDDALDAEDAGLDDGLDYPRGPRDEL